MKGLFSSVSILKENFNTNHDTLMSIKSNIENDSLFFEAVDFSLSVDKDYCNANEVLYKAIMESGDNQMVINEAFEGFFSSIKKIIKKVINFLKKIWNKFVNIIMRLIRSDSYLKDHLDDLSAFSSEDEFEYKGYHYTFKSNVPNESPLTDLVDKVVDKSTGDFAKITDDNKKTATAMKQMYEEVRDELESGSYYDGIRAAVLGKQGLIEETEYNSELFKIFRDDEDSTDTFTVDYSYISTIRNRYKNYDKDLKAVKKVRKDVEDVYKKLEDAYEKISKNAKIVSGKYTVTVAPANISVADVEKEAMNWYDLWGKARAGQIQKISNIHSMAFSSKLDAMKEAFRQDRDVLYKALGKVKSHHQS